MRKLLTGLVGLLNLNASMAKAGIPFSTLWSEKFTDAYFKAGLRQWLNIGSITGVRDVSVTNTGVAPTTTAMSRSERAQWRPAARRRAAMNGGARGAFIGKPRLTFRR